MILLGVVADISLTTILILGVIGCLGYAIRPKGSDATQDVRTTYWVGIGLLIAIVFLGGNSFGPSPSPTPEPTPIPSPTPLPPIPGPTPNPQPFPTPFPTPQPIPNPTPLPPTPLPTPGTPFQSQVVASWNGTREEALMFSGMFIAAADGLTFDGQRTDPKIKNSNDFGYAFNDIQRYVGLSETPWAGRFANTKNVIVSQMEAVGIIPRGQDTAIVYTPSVRSSAASLYREIGNALAMVP